MRRFKKLFSEAKIEVDDISVGKKKKAPAGVKVDPNLKGYAYNEKRVTDIDVEQGERDLKMAKLKKAKQKVQNEASDMSLDDIKKKYAKEIIAFQDGDGELSHGAKMAMYGYHGSDAIKTDDPDEFDKFVLGLQMGKYKKTNEQQAMDTLLDMLEETNLDEALSPKEKEKRLMMIKKAVEKLNRANIEKVKKQAMRDMKASGMFDDAIEEDNDRSIKIARDRNHKIADQTEILKDKIARLKDLRKTATVTDRIDDNIKSLRDQISKLDKEHARNRLVIKTNTGLSEHVKGGSDSYAALQNAKRQAKKQGKVWDRLGKDVKDRLIDKEMVALGYEKKPGNSQYTKIPTEKEKAFADKVRADDAKVRKMSDKDKTQYYIDNPSKSHGGDNVSEKGKIKIQISKYEDVVKKYDDYAQKAMEKAMEAEQNDDDMAFEKYQDEEQAYQDKADDFRRKVDELKDKLSDME
jgi:IMP cyclohydrolase